MVFLLAARAVVGVGVVVSCPGSSLKETERRNRRMRLPCVFYGDKGNSIRKPREKKRGENGDLLPLESFSLLSSCEDSNQERGRREGGGRWARERGGRGKEEGREGRRVTVRPSRSEGRAERERGG